MSARPVGSVPVLVVDLNPRVCDAVVAGEQLARTLVGRGVADDLFRNLIRDVEPAALAADPTIKPDGPDESPSALHDVNQHVRHTSTSGATGRMCVSTA